MKRALVVGGTGPSGPFLVNGLRDRGYTVAIFHRGTHEIPEIPNDVEHIHGDPHFRETIDSALNRRDFDVVIATYGRIRILAEALTGRTGQFIAIGGGIVGGGSLGGLIGAVAGPAGAGTGGVLGGAAGGAHTRAALLNIDP